MTKKTKAYARAGVDVDLANRLKRDIQRLVRRTHGPQVLGKIGGFGGLFRGLSRACRASGCALIGGETAQLPGMYRPGEYDLAGCIVGLVDRPDIISSKRIRPCDVVLGLA